jgi:hypothetical protein
MFARVGRSWKLMKCGGRILFNDPEMLVFPLLAGLASLVVMTTFAAPFFLSQMWGWSHSSRQTEQQVLYLGSWLLTYFALYFVIYFFNTAMVACAFIRMQGGNPTVRDGMSAAVGRFWPLVGWALLAGTVGMVLKVIESRKNLVASLVAGILGFAWTITSFLVVPVLVMEKVGPFAALRESTRLLRSSWAEQFIGGLSFGFILFLLNIPGLLLLVGAFAAAEYYQSWKVLVSGIGSAVLWFVLLALVNSAIQSIYQAAVFLYARDGQVPSGFDPGMFADAGEWREAA